MSYTLRFRGIIVGRSELEDADESTRLLRGAFRPGTGYELLQPIFRLYAEAMREPGGSVADREKLERYQRARETLVLDLQDAAGHAVPTSSIHIDDFRDERGAAALALEVRVDDAAFWSARRAGRDAGRPTA